ncbi:hypothetical protein LUZ60_009065 [Juncus effusus]|nr:hypothetical protein LUZ60_009065 [Juncus effusus]
MNNRRIAAGNRHRRRNSGGGGGRRSGPHTPLLRWSIDDPVGLPPDGVSKPERKSSNDKAGSGQLAQDFSVRRLAAAVWRIRPPEMVAAAGGGGGGERCSQVDFQSIPRHLHVQLLKPLKPNLQNMPKIETSSPNSVLDPKTCDFNKLDSAEKATKWDPESLNSSSNFDAYKLATQLNLTENYNEIEIVSNLQFELDQARAKISKLETEKQNAKKKIDQFLSKISEEKLAWRKREHEKVRSILNDMKSELEKEKRNRKRLDILNSKLANELKENKMNTMQLMQDFEKERKNRELIEEVCDELAKEVEEDKIEIEGLKRECYKFREEIDEERKMLQMAEVWREERVQMKLIDAKITLENKYSELQKLKREMEIFLMEGQKCDFTESDNLLNKLNSVINEREMNNLGFNYEPPKESEDIITIFEELKEIEPIYQNNPEKYENYESNYDESEIQVASPDTDIFLEKPKSLFENMDLNHLINDESESEGEISSWETISQDGLGISTNSIEGSEPSVNNKKIHEEIQISLNEELTQIYSLENNTNINNNNNKPVKKKESAISRLLWKSARMKYNEKKEVDEISNPRNSISSISNPRNSNARISNGRFSNARTSNARSSIGTYSPEIGLHEMSPQSMSSMDSTDLQSRGFRGCIECPIGMQQKHSLKAKLMEARMESQKVQLRHVLQQKY